MTHSLNQSEPPVRIAINGYGRIGRCVLRALYESSHRKNMQVVAINEPADMDTIIHLTKYDSVHGRFPGQVIGNTQERTLNVNGDNIFVSSERDLKALPWSKHQIDIVLECSGKYMTRETLSQHLKQGAGKVLLSQPGEFDLKAIVYGINQHQLNSDDLICSAASCTSNCIVPVIDVLHRAFTIDSGIITTIHSAMNDQPVIDAYHHTDLRKTRAASQSIIPVDTGLAQGIARILPELDGKFSARALRVPTLNVSLMELSLSIQKEASASEVNDCLQKAATGHLKNILDFSDEPLASCDFNHDPRSAIIDTGETRVNGHLISTLAWFDNEWAYANRMLDITGYWLNKKTFA
ncbi:type I glyceraldehyde-3-phosphate dehydrogenase [Coraliomargarita sp. W4R53]